MSFLETLLSQTSHDYPEMRFVLFKLFWYHNKRIMRHVIADDRYRIIALVRRNKLEQYSSRKIAMKTGQWALLGRKSKQTRVDFNLAEFQRYLRQMKAGEANMVEMLRQREHFFLYYEEVAERIGELAEWLKLDTDSLLADGPKVLQKQNSTNVLERFSNPDTVRELLREEHLTEFIC